MIPHIENIDWTCRIPTRTLKVRKKRGKSVPVSEAKSQVELLHQISNIVSSDLSLEKVLRELIGLSVEVTGCDACLVYLVDRSSKEIVLRGSQLPHASEIGHIRMKMGEGITGWVVKHKSVVALASKASADARFQAVQTRH